VGEQDNQNEELKNQQEEEKKESIDNFQPSSLLPFIIEKLETDPPFRTFTLRLYAKILMDLCPPSKLEAKLFDRLALAYKTTINEVKRIVFQLGINPNLDPMFNFYETVLGE